MTRRNTARRDKHRDLIRRGKHPSYPHPEPPCHLCGQPIDYQAHHLDPLSFSVDHVVPLNAGGPDTLDNTAPAHRKCNRDKSDKPPDNWQRPGVTYVTERIWSAT